MTIDSFYESLVKNNFNDKRCFVQNWYTKLHWHVQEIENRAKKNNNHYLFFYNTKRGRIKNELSITAFYVIISKSNSYRKEQRKRVKWNGRAINLDVLPSEIVVTMKLSLLAMWRFSEKKNESNDTASPFSLLWKIIATFKMNLRTITHSDIKKKFPLGVFLLSTFR